MLRRACLTLLVLGSVSAALAFPAPLEPAWKVIHNSPDDWTDSGEAVAVGADGSVYVTGYAYRRDAGPDIVTFRYDAAGRSLWSARYASRGPWSDSPTAIGLDDAGNVYVAGRAYLPVNGGGWDYVLLKYFPDGRLHWIRRRRGWPGLAEDGDYTPTRLVVAPEGGAYLSGDGGNGYIVCRYAANGSLLWEDNYGPVDPGPWKAYPHLTSMAPAADGGVLLGGSLGLPLDDRADVLVVRYKPSGERSQWVLPSERRVYAQANGVVSDGDGGVYVAGTRRTLSSPLRDMLFARIGPDGSVLWTTTHDVSPLRDDVATAAAVDPRLNLVVTGFSRIGTQDASTNLITLKLNPSGVSVWTRVFDGPAQLEDRPVGLAVDAAGRVVVAGTVGGGPSVGYANYLLLRYAPDGAELGLAQFNGRADLGDRARGLALDRAGNAAITGGTSWRGDMIYGVDLAIATAFFRWGDPPSLSELRASGDSVRGGRWLQGVVRLSAPAEELTHVQLGSSHPELLAAPAAVRIDKRSGLGYFKLRARGVTAPVAVTVTATLGDITRAISVGVRP